VISTVVADAKARAARQVEEIEVLRGDVLAQGAGLDLEAGKPQFIDTLLMD
jgi:hypothetical protein